MMKSVCLVEMASFFGVQKFTAPKTLQCLSCQALAMGDRFEDLWKAEVERFGDQAARKNNMSSSSFKKGSGFTVSRISRIRSQYEASECL